MAECARTTLLREANVRASVSVDDAVRAVEESFALLARGRVTLPPPISMDLPGLDAAVHVKGGYVHGADVFVFKEAAGFHRNAAKGLPVGSGLVMVFSADTGALEALVLDNGYLTDLRTGATGAVAARHLAPEALKKVALVGAGLEARFQLRALKVVRQFERVEVWSRTHATAAAFASDMRAELECDVTPHSDLEHVVRDADLVITTTPSRVPLVRAEWLQRGAHITAIGSDVPEKQELAVDVLTRADRVVADSLAQCLESGELHHAHEAGVLDLDAVSELGSVVDGTAPGRRAADEITVFDSTGVGSADVAIAAAALAGARSFGLGEPLA